jgi:glycerol-3-phosphate cytidylyltransferase
MDSRERIRNKIMKKILALGAFDILHIGHIHLITRAATLGDYLIIGVTSDALYYHYKKKTPIFSDKERASIISAIKGVDEVFINDGVHQEKWFTKYKPEALVFGKDWEGKIDDDLIKKYKIIYLDRTDFVSSSAIQEKIRNL